MGWACPAGHIKAEEKPLEGTRRETKEETNVTLVKPRLVFSQRHVRNRCVKGSLFHDWWVFEASARGKVRRNKGEAKSIGWFSPEEIKKLKLEPIWKLWFKKLKIL